MAKGEIIVLNHMIMKAVQSDESTEAEEEIVSLYNKLDHIGEEGLADLLFNIWSGVIAFTPVYNRLQVARILVRSFDGYINREE